MCKKWGYLCGILVFLFIICVSYTALGQQSKPGSTALEYTVKIDPRELTKNITDLTNKIKELTDSQKTLIDNVTTVNEKHAKEIKELNDKFIAIDERTKNIRSISIGILLTLIGGLVSFVVGVVLYFLFGRNKQNQLVPELATLPEDVAQKGHKDKEYEYRTDGVPG